MKQIMLYVVALMFLSPYCLYAQVAEKPPVLSVEELMTKYESAMIKEEAPAFRLLDTEGKEVALEDFRGQVVVLDFWATWCSPCKASFPGMQAAVDKYKDDKDVKFLFIDTWEKKDVDYKTVSQEFIKEKGYTFHVVYDHEDRSKAAVTAYRVEGIPTKVVIDKEGFIRFQQSGGGFDVQRIVNELSAKIELAKRG